MGNACFTKCLYLFHHFPPLFVDNCHIYLNRSSILLISSFLIVDNLLLVCLEGVHLCSIFV